MVKHGFILLLLSAWDAHYMDDWDVLREGYKESGGGQQQKHTKILHTTS